tara:strand:+ start:281 stop:463 length:183 start_codon:yes stop_codon:yes gene_type:complete
MSKPEYTLENCEILAETVVASMSWEELKQFVFDDIYSIVREEEEVFNANVEHYWDTESKV